MVSLICKWVKLWTSVRKKQCNTEDTFIITIMIIRIMIIIIITTRPRSAIGWLGLGALSRGRTLGGLSLPLWALNQHLGTSHGEPQSIFTIIIMFWFVMAIFSCQTDKYTLQHYIYFHHQWWHHCHHHYHHHRGHKVFWSSGATLRTPSTFSFTSVPLIPTFENTQWRKVTQVCHWFLLRNQPCASHINIFMVDKLNWCKFYFCHRMTWCVIFLSLIFSWIKQECLNKSALNWAGLSWKIKFDVKAHIATGNIAGPKILGKLSWYWWCWYYQWVMWWFWWGWHCWFWCWWYCVPLTFFSLCALATQVCTIHAHYIQYTLHTAHCLQCTVLFWLNKSTPSIGV